ncbi:MAG: sugar phosphate isomerase/epimerase family protein [Pirellulaceae bacterium]
MYKILCTDGLGVTIRQNELIELALTYGYKGIEIDMEDMIGRAEKMGHQFATQFVNSASVEIGTFRLPIDFDASDEDFAAQAAKLDAACELAKSIGATHCYVRVSPTHPSLPYVENFEKHRTRLAEVAGKLAEIDTKLGLQFSAGQPNGDNMQFIHKPEEIVALVKSVGHPNCGLVVDTWNWQVGGGSAAQIRELNLAEVFEVRLADPPENFDPANADRTRRLEPGQNSASLCQDALNWLQESNFEGPVAITAHIPKSGGNPGDILYQRIAKVFDDMIAGVHGQVEEEPAAAEGEEASEESAAKSETVTTG